MTESGDRPPPFSQLDQQAMRALSLQNAASAVPLLRKSGSKNWHVEGSALLFKAASYYFVVTAKHVGYENPNDPDESKMIWGQLYFPDRQRSRLIRLDGHAYFTRPHSTDPDVAIIHLSDATAAQIASGDFAVATPQDLLGQNSPMFLDQYHVCGFPSACYPPAPDFRVSPKHFYMTSYAGTPSLELDYRPELHLLLQRSEQGYGLNGDLRDLPPLPGISGCPVWQLTDHPGVRPGEVWHPAKFQLAGVETGISKGMMRATRWGVVARMMSRQFPDLRPIFESVYGPMDFNVPPA